MGNERVYASDAERQRAYRARLAEGRPKSLPAPVKRTRLMSRPAQLARLMDNLQAMILGYEGWEETQPDSLKETALADKLRQAIEQLTAALDLLAEVDLPRGFGRD